MSYVEEIKNELKQHVNTEKAEFFPKFFQAYKGGYGEGDKFIGVTVPNLRKVAKKYYKQVRLNDIETLLTDAVHEYRLTALFMLVNKFEKAKIEEQRKQIADFYINNYMYINNWDLVDSSAYKILGPYLIDKDKKVLYDFANSDHLWKQRIAIISTMFFIKNDHYDDTLKIAKILLHNKHDLIHKAVGWMLREIGKRDIQVEIEFLKKYYKEMPRTMLRYAIEKFDSELRQKFLKGEITKE